jgi:xylulokinase
MCARSNTKGNNLLFLGIDIGTSEVKAALVNEDGTEVACVAAEYQWDRTWPGFAEIAPELLWKGVCNAVRRLTAATVKTDIRAGALSVHGESFIVLDAHGRAITPVILNVDSRGAAEMDEFVRSFGREELYRRTGLPPHPMYTLPKIAWLRKHRPAVLDRAAQFLCLHDYLLGRITRTPVIDVSLASRTLGFNVVDCTWDEPLLAAAGVSSSQMAPISTGGVPVGHASREVARDLGLPESVLWVTGGHDQACCSLGADGLAAATAVDGTGTFECISIAREDPLISGASAKANIPCERHTVPGRFLSLTYAPGGVVLKWCRDQLAQDVAASAASGGASAYSLMLAKCPPEPSGLLFLPYIFGTGTPWLNVHARAVFSGISFSTSRDSMVKAAIEGVTFEMRWNLEVLEDLGVAVKRIMAVGGGAKSPVWLQLKADIFGHEVIALEGEATCRGAAICAGLGAGVFDSFEEGAKSLLPPGRAYQPREPALTQYKELFVQYKELAHRLYGFAPSECGSPFHAVGST